jgi:hypothetical protein
VIILGLGISTVLLIASYVTAMLVANAECREFGFAEGRVNIFMTPICFEHHPDNTVTSHNLFDLKGGHYITGGGF